MATMKQPPCKNPVECYKRCKNGAFPCDYPNPREYTLSIKGRCKSHVLVNQAYDKGLTGVRIIKYPNKAAPMARSGWYLECNEIASLHLGYEIAEASNRINQISIKKP
jgi:hypothetical protein